MIHIFYMFIGAGMLGTVSSLKRKDSWGTFFSMLTILASYANIIFLRGVK